MFDKNIMGLDVDDLKLGRQTLRMLRILNIKGKYRLSSSKKGYHFRLNVRDHTIKENLEIRYCLGDCYGRWMSDFRRFDNGLKHIDILFDKKKNKKSGKWKKI
jgi:hypothetical protein